MDRSIYIASRGSALALVQANMILSQCRESFPSQKFELKIIKTTGDKLQTASPTSLPQENTKGLFTKELEVALLSGDADLAVHSLKDLPTELPAGLILGAASPRADVRDVLIYRDVENSVLPGSKARTTLHDLPEGATIATSSTRRQAQLRALRPDFKTVPIRGNVGTRLQKLATQRELDAIVLAAAGLQRLGFRIEDNGHLSGEGVPASLLAIFLSTDEMLPCVGQAALGIEIRENDPQIALICERLNDPATNACVTAERAFLHAMGGGCLSPVAALALVKGDHLHMRAVSYRNENVVRTEGIRSLHEARELGRDLALRLEPVHLR